MEFDQASTGYTSHNRVKLIRGGADYFNLAEELIDQAVHSVHLQMYIFVKDETGTRIADALARAAFRKVHVYLMLDGYASGDLDKGLIERLRESGVHFRWFQPIVKGKAFYVGRRMHHKLLVVDGLHSLVGGVNVSNRYNDLHDQPAWLDYAIHVVGEASSEILNRCINMWSRTMWAKIGRHKVFNWNNLMPVKSDVFARIRINDWIRNRIQISRSYQEMFHRANKQITILSAYFVPGTTLRRHLVKASKRGVSIRVILTARSDIFLGKAAERYFYPWLLEQNVEIHEYSKSVLHGKLATYDRQWATIGSYNVNSLSAYASIELNVDVHNADFAATVDDELNSIISNCTLIDPAAFQTKTNFLLRIKRRISYEFYRIAFFLFTFYYRQERER